MSTPTRLDAETALYGRWSGALLWVYQRDNDPVTGDPPPTNQAVTPDPNGNPLYSDPISYALTLVGHPPANPAAVSDADVAAAAAAWINFLDLGEYRLLLNLIGSFTDTTESDFGRSADYAKLADRWAKRASELGVQLKMFLNPFRVGASSGTIRHTPPTAFIPKWGPGYGGPAGRGRGGYGGFGGGWGGW